MFGLRLEVGTEYRLRLSSIEVLAWSGTKTRICREAPHSDGGHEE